MSKCQWCGKRRSVSPVRTNIDHAPGVRTAGEVCATCNAQLRRGAARLASIHVRPGDVASTATAIGRIAELHFLDAAPSVVLELDNGQRIGARVADLTEVQSVMLPRLLWCGVAMTVDHAAIRAEAA